MIPDPNLIPGYEILDRVASGGVASVFRARRVRDGLETALKVMSLGDIDPEFHPVERFQREAALLERLNHQALPRLYEYGVTEGGLGWMALELVRGQPLSQLQGRPAIELLPVFIQVAEGLQAVTQEGIVHRDISPDNILVEDRYGRLHARLIDFGIAKDILSGEGAGGLTQHGAFLGKLAYASPEQLVGLPKGETIDFRSDVYSLGMTMYELLAGRRAILADGLSEVVDGHIKGNFPPLTVAPERGGPAPRLVALVTRMISRRRDDRPASWEEILADLWRSREELSPLSETLARKRADSSQTDMRKVDVTITRPPERARERKGADPISREVLLGRVVFIAGIVSFVGAMAFAGWYFIKKNQAPPDVPVVSAVPTPDVSAPAPTPVPVPTKRAPTPHPTRSAPTPTPEPEVGTLDVALLPAGDLDEIVDEGGKRVAGKRSLPTIVELPPGRYRMRIVARGMDCTKYLPIVVRPGKTTTVRESCIEVK